MVGRSWKLAVMLFALAAPGVVSATQLVAIVHSVEVPDSSVGALEMIERGRVFELGSDGRLVLGYFRSCIREEITGGRVTVGSGRSQVDGGRVARRRVECEVVAIELTQGQAANSAGVIFRGPKEAKALLE